MARYKKTVELFSRDFSRTLFPLNTNKILVENIADRLGSYIYQEITHEGKKGSFSPQTKAYADKSEHHLRRTFKLDPVAEFFIYDLVYRNRNAFRKSHSKNRKSYGYNFKEGNFVSPSQSYSMFKSNVHKALKDYKYAAKFDVAVYFNSIYHHDLVNWFSDLSVNEDDVHFFDKFLRQINVGRSVDCLPQGIMPAKIIGNNFLNFIDNSNRIQSELLLRFMDDFYLFSDDFEMLLSDFFKIQRMLGEKALSINSAKTKTGDFKQLNIQDEIDDIKVDLLRRRRNFILVSGWDDDDEEIETGELSEEEVDYLFSLLKQPHIEEDDAELILAVMRDHSEDVLEYIPNFLNQFPNLIKNIFYFCNSIEDREELSSIIRTFLKEAEHITEYQLFWIGKMAEEFLSATKSYGEILISLFEHENATKISKAKVLEIPETRFGMSDLREEHLRTGSSEWLSWSSAIGARAEKKRNRNHVLKYFSNAGAINKLISECVIKL